MSDSDRLERLYREVLGKGPFPSIECAQAQITRHAHAELILYLADIAGVASRGEEGLSSLSETEKQNFRKLASRSISARLPNVCERITPEATPELHSLIEATERARLLILDALDSPLT